MFSGQSMDGLVEPAWRLRIIFHLLGPGNVLSEEMQPFYPR